MKNRNHKMFVLALAALLLSLISSPAWAAPAGKIVAWGSGEFGVTNVPPGDDFVAIAAGRNAGHALALRSDGSLAGWGLNYGVEALGSADILYGQAIVPAGNDFKAIAAGAFHSLALRTNGSLVGWGANEFIGHGDFTGQATVPAGNDFVAIDAGDFHSLALRSDGSLVAWGENSGGQTNASPGNDFVAIAAGDWHNLALKSDGSIVVWGEDDYGQVRNKPTGTNFVAIAGGVKYSLALRSDGSMVGWGAIGAFETGAEVPPEGTNFVAIAAGYGHSLALESDGSMVGWGSNYKFDDPDPARPFYGQAIPRIGTNFIAIVASSFFSLAIQVQPPVLTIDQIGNNITISWSTNHTGYTLEAKADLNSPLHWSNIIGIPTIVGDQFVLTNSITGATQFFRLIR
jgi:alpha-tubulin suppressor-like RCC1 family protein